MATVDQKPLVMKLTTNMGEDLQFRSMSAIEEVGRLFEFSVLALPNLNGDYISDALAALVGGIGIAPGANIADHVALFEATHGTAPKYANQDKVNPGSLLFSGVMMLEYMRWKEVEYLAHLYTLWRVRKRVQRAFRKQ